MIDLKTRRKLRVLEGLYGGERVSENMKPVLTPDNAVDQADASITGTLAWHIADANGAVRTVTVYSGTYQLETGIILPSTMYLDVKPGAYFRPRAGASLIVDSPENIIASGNQKIIDFTYNSDNPLKFVTAGQFSVNWWGTDDKSAQMAIVEFGRTPGCHMKFVGEHTWSGGVKLTYTADSKINSKISGWDSVITSTVNGSYVLEFESGSYNAKLLTLEGLHFECGGNESGCILFDADSDCTNFFFNVTIRNVFMNEFGGHGIEFEGCFFESRVVDSDFRTSNTTGYCIYFNGIAQSQSSMALYECTTRGGKHGIYATGTREIYINGGTYINAQEEGIFLNAARNTVINPHVEHNWLGGGTGAGLTFSGSGTIIGLRATKGDENQLYGARIYVSAESHSSRGSVQVIGGEWDQTSLTAFIQLTGAADTNLIVDAHHTIEQAVGNVTVTRSVSDVQYTDVSTSGTGEDDLMSYTVDPYMMPRRSSMHIVANGTMTNANDDKTIKFHLGNDAIIVHPADIVANNWILEVWLFVTTTAAVDIIWKFTDGTDVTQGNTGVAQDYTASYDIKLTGECAHADDVITQDNMLIKYQ